MRSRAPCRRSWSSPRPRRPRARRSPRNARPRPASGGSRDEPPRSLDHHRLDLVLAEAGAEELVRPDREPVLDGWVVRVAAVAGEDVPFDPDRANAVEDVLVRGLAAVRRGQAALDQTALVRERDLVLDREVLASELRMRDHNGVHA